MTSFYLITLCRWQDFTRVLISKSKFGSLLPATNTQSKFLQVDFIVDEEAQVDRRSEYVPGVERNTVQKLQRVPHDHNILVHELI